VQRKKEKMEKIKNLWNTTVDELLNKVTWPTWEQLRESAIIVLVSSMVFSVLVYLVDIGVGKILEILYGIGK